ncbi:fibrinogen-like protein A [Dysidea avara]|uniref:fibrinogen-like protein A n=1 Tax=Dysidea avara TaxID=196820 RepID=UPI0033288E48
MKIIYIQIVALVVFLSSVNADEFCRNYVDQYTRFRSECSVSSIVLNSCCDLQPFQLSVAPSGVYRIRKTPFDTADAYCDMNTTDGGWMVIQRNRINSTTNFNRNYTEYEQGFGNLLGDFWYGLEALHCLTQRVAWEMRIDYQLATGTTSFLHYNTFSVNTAATGYQLIATAFTGIGTNFLSTNTGRRFSTVDNDNSNCARTRSSGWWYSSCGVVALNSPLPRVQQVASFVEMKIRPRNCNVQIFQEA